MLEGFITGLIAAIVGLFCGFLLAKGLNAFFKAVGVDLPTKGTVLQTRTVVVSLLVGVGITMLATISPARKATNVPPIAAVREGATLAPSRIASSPVTASVVLGLAVLALALGLFGGLAIGAELGLIGLGCIMLFVGVGLISSRLVKPLAAALGAPGERFGGVSGQLAKENATRNPTRTARTAGALMIGLALVTLVATLGASIKGTNRGALEDQVRADYVVTSDNGFDPFTTAAGKALDNAPGVAVASSVRSDSAVAFGNEGTVTGVDPATIGQVYDYRWNKGSDSVLLSLGVDGAVVRDDVADTENLAVGDKFSITTPQGKKVPLVVRGIYKPPSEQLDPLLGEVTLAQRAFDQHFPRPKDLFSFVDTDEGVTSQTTAALEKTLGPFPDAVLHTKADWVDERAGGIDIILNIFYVLLALSVVVSLFGLVNALALAVFERTREIGMLRAIGLTRRQTRRMIRHEGIITALIGAALGLPLGVFIAAVIVQGLHEMDVTFSLPVVIITVVRDRRNDRGDAGSGAAGAAGVAPERPPGAAIRIGGSEAAALGAAARRLRRVACGAAGLGLGGLDLAVLRRRVGHELAEQALAHRGHLVDGPLERLGVRLRRLREAADLADVLERGCADLVLGGRWIEVMECSDVAAHASRLAAPRPRSPPRVPRPRSPWRRRSRPGSPRSRLRAARSGPSRP